MIRRTLGGVLLLGLVGLGLTGCPDNPYKASSWTKKLNDPREAERAVTELEQLGDPSAIEALGQAWQTNGRPVRLLQVIISLARPLTPKEAAEKFVTDYAESGRPASWDKALPFLKQALDEVDENNPRSVDSAQKAADALGEAKIADALDSLATLANKKRSKKLIAAEVAAVRALGKFDTEKARAGGVLAKLIDQVPPPHPKTAKDDGQKRQFEEEYGLFLGVSGASINALGDLRVASAVPTLVKSLYRTPELFTQIRRALVASGPTAADELRKILRGDEQDINTLISTNRYDKYCGDKVDATHECLPVSAKDFYPAVVLGDFYDPKAVPDLLTALARPPLPVYYQAEEPSPNTQYNAIFDSLRKIGSPDAASVVRAKWEGHAAPAPKGPPPKKGAPPPPPAAGEPDVGTRILAVSAYPFVARDNTGVEDLGKIAGDNGADQTLRQEAATAFARMASDAKDIAVLDAFANKYFTASAEKRKAADGKPKTDNDTADKEFEVAKKTLDKAKTDALKATHDPSKSAAEIKAAADGAKKAEDDFKVAKKTHGDKTKEYKGLDGASKAYKGFARMFQTHIARIEVAIRCKDDLTCYAATLKLTPDQSKTNLKAYISDLADWTKDETLGLWEGEVERAMLEIGKRGSKASNLTDTLLESAKSDDRLVRQSILLALPKIAKTPCDNCEIKLDAAIKAGEGKTTLGDLNLETTMLRNYFAWAGGRVPSSTPPPADVPNEVPVKTPAAPAEKAPAEAAPAKAATPAPAPAKPAPAKPAPKKKK